MTCREPF
ncbi:hypothetical protein YPPY101_1556, partial [Yersinia pestis PY-101]